MATPKRIKTRDVESTDRSPKNFRWAHHYEDTLLDLLLRESRKGNRPESTFTALAFRTIVTDFNRVHGTNIMKKHVQSRIKTMKQHFVLFHGAFNGLSGFAWNADTKMFEAEDFLWEERISENPKLEKLRDKPCHNWDKLFELYGDTRATGAGASGMKDTAKKISRGIDFEEVRIGLDGMRCGDTAANEGSSCGEHNQSRDEAVPLGTPEFQSTEQTAGSSRSKLKRKSTLISVMKDGYKTMAASIDKLSTALSNTGEKVAGTSFDVNLNTRVYESLASLALEDTYRVRCYTYLCSNPSKAAILVAAPNVIRLQLLDDIMKDVVDQH